tara:strand:+ start:754 stop:1062 length:309 start_codon:yes stop_codon:yes gene_type:complete
VKNFFIMILILSIGVSLSGCAKTDTIKDWLKEGTKDYQEEKKKITKTNKDGIQNLLERKGCVSGSSAKIIETDSTDYKVYEVTCVKKSKRFIVKCDENACSE